MSFKISSFSIIDIQFKLPGSFFPRCHSPDSSAEGTIAPKKDVARLTTSQMKADTLMMQCMYLNACMDASLW